MNVQRLKQQFNGGNDSPVQRAAVRTHIPVARFGGRGETSPVLRRASTDSLLNGNPPNTQPSPDKWKPKYDDLENRRKLLLTQHQKLSRDHEDLQQKYNKVQRELEMYKTTMQAKETQMNQLRKVSEAVYKEYEKLKNQYELETATLQQAVQRASLWYKENRELKRRSAVLMQRVMQVAPDKLSEFVDDTDSGVSTDSDEFDELRKSVQDLNHEVARLQAEMNAARLQEFEAQETIVDLTSQLEEERNARALVESELNELRDMKSNIGQVSRLVAAEVASLREQCEKEKETAQRMKRDADTAMKERNVLVHQSQLLMCDVVGDDRLMQMIMEVESLKRSLEEEHQRHSEQIQTLQEKLEERECDSQLELLEEKLQLVEAELSCALQRAERAETISHQLSVKLSTLEEEMLNKCPPPPPPPPLPPPLPPSLVSSTPAVKRPGVETTHASTAVLEMANLLGLPRKVAKPPDAPGAIDDIINEIKGGRFTLKSTDPKPRLNKVEEQPPVVQEMINVLGTLRKRRAPSRQQTEKAPADALMNS